jgi:hypothetical protein
MGNLSNRNKPSTTHTRDSIPTEIRTAVWIKYHGNSNKGYCYCCNGPVTRYNRGWHCSHVIADVKGGTETLDNLRVCCPHCNLSMGDQNLYAYIRDKQLTGPGSNNINYYMKKHPDQKFDTRTNNWRKNNSKLSKNKNNDVKSSKNKNNNSKSSKNKNNDVKSSKNKNNDVKSSKNKNNNVKSSKNKNNNVKSSKNNNNAKNKTTPKASKVTKK